jgi:hypothetical protein
LHVDSSFRSAQTDNLFKGEEKKESMNTPKQAENLCRKVARKLCAQGRRTGTGLHIEGVKQTAKGKRRMAIVSVGRSDFYDPTVAIQSALKNLFDPNLAPHPVRQVDVATVDYQAPSETKFRGHAVMPMLAFVRRMNLIARDDKYLRCWKARHKYGMFFLYRDRVILQTWSPREGFHVLRVPEDGLEGVLEGIRARFSKSVPKKRTLSVRPSEK